MKYPVKFWICWKIDSTLPSKGFATITAINNEKIIHAKTVIISTGASAKYLGLESEQRLIGGGVSACAVCDGFFYKNQEVAIVGGGDTAAEEATYLSNICSKVTMLVRKDHMRASKAMQHRVNSRENIELKYNSEVKEVLGENVVEGLKIINNKTNERSITYRICSDINKSLLCWRTKCKKKFWRATEDNFKKLWCWIIIIA